MEDPERTYKLAGMSTLDLEKPTEHPDKKFDCLICLEEYHESETFALSCGHRYCNNCWKGYLEVQVKEGPRAVYTKCPSPKCKCIVNEEAFKKLVSKEVLEKYTTYMLRSFVEDNAQVLCILIDYNKE
jgi:ariadne-1